MTSVAKLSLGLPAMSGEGVQAVTQHLHTKAELPQPLLPWQREWQGKKLMTNRWKSRKIHEKHENPWKSMKIHGNPSTKTWKTMKIQENLMKIHEHPEFSTTRPNVFKIPKSQPLSNQPLTHLPLKNAHLSTRSKSSNCLERFCSKALAFVSQFQKKNAVPTHFNLEP